MHRNSASSPRSFRPSRVLLLGLAAALASIGFAPTASAAPKEYYGVVPEGLTKLQNRDFSNLKRGKVRAMRFQLTWGNIEGTPDVYNWSQYDELIENLARAGVRPTPFIFGTPGWMDSNPFAVPKSKADIRQMREFITDVVARYGSKGSFWAKNPSIPFKPVKTWQFLNEVNSSKFYAPRPSPKGYAKLLKVASKAVKRSDGRGKVLLAGMFGTPNKGQTAWGYLRKLYKVKGIEKTFDGVALHPYSPNIRGIRFQLDKARAEMKRAGDQRTGIHITEIGWGSSSGKNELEKGTKGQAKLVKQSAKLIEKTKSWKVKQYFYYALRDPEKSFADPCPWCPSAGLFKNNLKPKPSWKAFVRLTGGKS